MNKKNIAWAIRIVIALLFIVSAVAKLSKGQILDSPYFAISTFEVKQLYTLGFSETIAPYFSRILIGIEFALGFLLLINHHLKRITIPITIGLLVVFIGHLSYVTFLSGGNTGNCGCFGELIPMTPIEAIIKNIIAVGLLVWLWKILENDKKSNFWILTTVTLACILGLFMIAPMKASTTSSFESTETIATEIDSLNSDSTKITTDLNLSTDLLDKSKDSLKTKTEKVTEDVKKDVGPKSVFSGFLYCPWSISSTASSRSTWTRAASRGRGRRSSSM